MEKKIGRVKRGEIALSALRCLLSSLVMGGVVWFLISRFDFGSLIFIRQLGLLMGVIAVGILVYVLLNVLFNHEDLKRLRAAFSRDKILEDK